MMMMLSMMIICVIDDNHDDGNDKYDSNKDEDNQPGNRSNDTDFTEIVDYGDDYFEDHNKERHQP